LEDLGSLAFGDAAAVAVGVGAVDVVAVPATAGATVVVVGGGGGAAVVVGADEVVVVVGDDDFLPECELVGVLASGSVYC
jgi:hypothetical protein